MARTIFGNRIGVVNIQGGEFTYGNRIALADIFKDEGKTEYQKMKEAFREIYGYSCRWLPRKKRYRTLIGIVEGFSEWIKRENTVLDYKPTQDQLRAGIEQYSKAVGSMSTVHAIAERFSEDPDTVLRWDYAKVFGILFVDLERYKYQQRERKVIDEKYSGNNRFRTR